MRKLSPNPAVLTIIPPQEITLPYDSPVIYLADYLGVELVCAYGQVSTTGAVRFTVQGHWPDLAGAAGEFMSVADDYLLGSRRMLALPAVSSRTSGVDQFITRRLGIRMPSKMPGFRVRLFQDTPNYRPPGQKLMLSVAAVVTKST